MLYGTPQRREHRAPGGALALFGSVIAAARPPGRRGSSGAGQHRSRAARSPDRQRSRAPRAPDRPRPRAVREPPRTAQFLVRGLAALILLALISLTAFFVLAGRNGGGNAEAGADPIAAGMLASRTVDAAPLTVEEIFPDSGTVRPAGTNPYRITLTHIDADCRSATSGDLGDLLVEHGCSQVVRAGLVAPYGDYRVTAGMFNLADAAGAVDVDDVLRHLVETGDGGLATLPAGRHDPDALPTAQVGWRTRGHYLLYCVINRPDDSLVAADDPYAARITDDLVDSYLGTTVLGRRAADAGA
ncbi:hypothetical protein ACIA5D_10765 [Actinoplanes sp. NPDC051513]|uniref:hypothetical protein n=1 Tax=Actinoplanes sp. NPDC051513 TaxID=3363908 RepID=UPI0037883697